MVRLIYLLFLSILLVGEYFCEEVHSSFSPKDVRGCIPSDTLADPWSPNADYPLWTLVRHRGELYQCCQPHRSTPEWAPSKVPSLWQIPTPCGTTEWRVQTAYQVGSVVTFNSQTYTCIQAHTSIDGWEPPATPALWNIVPGARAGTCVFMAQGGEIRQHIEARSSRSSGKSVLVIMDVVLTPSDGPPHAFSGLVFSASILLGADEVLSYHKTVLPDDTSHIELHWGPAVIGATSAVFDVRADQTVTGSIDGRRLAPFKITDTTSTLKLADGQALPSLHPQFDASSAFESLEVEIEAAVRSCNGPPSANTSTILRSRRDALDRTQDPGHFSFTKSADSCWFCKGAATGAVTTGTVICAVATCALTFGLSCAACVGGGAVAVAKAISLCEESNACCPVACSDGWLLGPGLCCFGSEKCLDGRGRCCSRGQTDCVGMACCQAGQSCIDKGFQKGTCCPNAAVCGNQCCPGDNDRCTNGICCPAGSECGTQCCNPYNPAVTPSLQLKTCADPVAGLCCSPGQHAVQGICCWPGQVPTNGICCASGRTNCGDGLCCQGFCDNGMCQWSRSGDDCRRDGFAAACVPDCSECREGCCLGIK